MLNLTTVLRVLYYMIPALLTVLVFGAGYKTGHYVRDNEAVIASKDRTIDDLKVEMKRRDDLRRILDESGRKAEALAQEKSRLEEENADLEKKYRASLSRKPPRPLGCPPSLSVDTVEYINALQQNANRRILEKVSK